MQRGGNNRRPRAPRYNQDQARRQNFTVKAFPVIPREVVQNYSETNTKSELIQQLHEVTEELALEKSLKEMEKARREEMERLWRAGEPETMNTFGIASGVCSTLKTKKEKELQMEFENLQMSHIIREQKFSAEIQLEREREMQLSVKNFFRPTGAMMRI